MSLQNRFKRAVLVLVAWLTSFPMGCTFSSPNPYMPPEQQAHDAINASPILPTYDASNYVVMEVPGKMKLLHGHSCAQPEKAAGSDYVGFRVQESIDMPTGFTGTVYLNGFRGDYDKGDRNMLGIGASIVNVEANTDKKELKWQASGVLGDNSGDDGFTWCYWYGVVLWNKSAPDLDVTAFQTDADPKLTTFIHKDDYDPGNDTALRDLPGSYMDIERRSPKAVIPRGFGLIYTDDDENLLQEGFDLGLPHSSGTQIEWTAQTIFKDEDDRKDYRGSMLVSYLMGSSVNVWQPEKVQVRDGIDPNAQFETAPGNDFQLVPRDDADWCGADGHSYRKHEYVVEDVPFDYAMPVLNGWDNGNFCGDSNVQSTGVWITEVYYEKSANALGKLRYTVASKFDDDGGWFGSDGNMSSHSVVILGFNEAIKGEKNTKLSAQVAAPLPTKAQL